MKLKLPYGPVLQVALDENEARAVQMAMLNTIDQVKKATDHVVERTRIFQSVLQRLDAELRRFDEVKYRKYKRRPRKKKKK